MFTEEENLVRVELHVLDVKVRLSDVATWPPLEQLISIDTLLRFTRQAKLQCVRASQGRCGTEKSPPSSGLSTPALTR